MKYEAEKRLIDFDFEYTRYDFTRLENLLVIQE